MADMVIRFGRYGLFVWPMWLWPIWSVADMVQTQKGLGLLDKEINAERCKVKPPGGAKVG